MEMRLSGQVEEASVTRHARAGAFGLGVVMVGAWTALVWASSARGAQPATEPPQWIAADRDADELVALASALLVTVHVPIEAPIEVALANQGRIWAACATAAGPGGAHVLRRTNLAGTIDLQLPIGPLFDLAPYGDGGALVVAGLPGGQREATLVHNDGTWRVLATAPDLMAICARAGQVLVAGEHGSLALYEPRVSRLATAQRDLGGMLADVAPGPSDGTWWVLDVAGSVSAHRLLLVRADLSTVWQRSIGLNALHLAPVRGEERVWLADGEGNFARRFGPQGVLEVSYAPLSMSGCDRGVATSDGGVVFAAPGALVALDTHGAARPGQGGFNFLVDLAQRGE